MSELNLILLGPPGSGKGTQGERLHHDLDLPYYATGDILRDAVKQDTELGKKAKEFMNNGDLVPVTPCPYSFPNPPAPCP